MKSIRKTFSKRCFKPVYERSKDQLLSQSTLFVAFYQRKASINEIIKQFGISPNEIYQEAFLKVPILNRSTKEAKISSFCRAPFIAFYQRKASINEILKRFGVSTNEIYQENTCAGDFLKYSHMADDVQRY